MGEENCGPCSNITSSPRGRAEARHSQRTERRRELPCRRLVHVLRTGRDLNRSLDDWVASRERGAARNGFFETRIVGGRLVGFPPNEPAMQRVSRPLRRSSMLPGLVRLFVPPVYVSHS